MAQKSLILAHDLGTTGNKASLFDADGALLGSAFAGYDTDYPQPNWAEQNPDDWWQAVCDTTRQLLAETGADPKTIAAIGFSGQMMGCVPIDAAGRPLRSCIIWADTRAQAQALRMADLCGSSRIYRTVGHPASPAYSAPKILWVRDEQPEIYEQTVCFLQPKDYLVYRLTGSLATDYSDASGTLLFDLETRSWDQEFLAALDLPEERLPALHASIDVVGEVTREAAAATGLAVGTPVVIGGGDGSCAGVGAGVIEPGDAYCNLGSSAWISVASQRAHPRSQGAHHHLPPCASSALRAHGHHAGRGRCTPVGVGTAGPRGCRSGRCCCRNASGEPAAWSFCPTCWVNGRPYWNPLARGTFVGLSMSHTRPQMARAVLEGVALHLRLILDALSEQVAGIETMRVIGGGTRSPLWRQILADSFRMPVHTLDLQAGATSWGAAVAAGVGVGLYDWSIADERIRVVDVTEPNADDMAFYDELASVFADTYSALEPIYERLARLT